MAAQQVAVNKRRQASDPGGRQSKKRRGQNANKVVETPVNSLVESGLHATCCRYMLHLLLTDTSGMVEMTEDNKLYTKGDYVIVPFCMGNILRFTEAIMKERERHTGRKHKKDHADAMLYGISAVKKRPTLRYLLDGEIETSPSVSTIHVPYDRRMSRKSDFQDIEGHDMKYDFHVMSRDNAERKAWEAFKEFMKRCNARPGRPDEKYADYLASEHWHICLRKRAYADVIPLFNTRRPCVPPVLMVSPIKIYQDDCKSGPHIIIIIAILRCHRALCFYHVLCDFLLHRAAMRTAQARNRLE